MLLEITDTFDSNYKRLINLVTLYESLRSANQGRSSTQQLELLRATVVFTHSTLEDFLRNLQAWKIPETDTDKLSQIWLLESQRKTKFSFQDLYKYKSIKVEKLIEKSVKNHLNYESYNQTNDIVSAIESCGLRVTEPIKDLFPIVTELMNRRHHIVHRADRNEKVGSGHHRFKSLNLIQVNKWIGAIDNLAEQLIIQIHDG